MGLPMTARKCDSIWVIMDRLSKSTHFVPINTNYKVQRYAEIYIAHVLCLHRVLKMITSDRVEFRNLTNYLTGRANMSAAHFPVATITMRRALNAGGCQSSPSTWVGPSLPLLQTTLRKSSPTPLFPLPRSAALLTALLHTDHCFIHHCLSPMSHHELSDRAKSSASSPRPSYTKSMPAVSASEARPLDFLVVVFLRKHLTKGSPLRLFPHPADPAASSSPPWSSSLTTSLATLTTPSASHRHLLPVGARDTAKVPLLVSTPFSTSPPRFSCSGM
jgi:hypothetical protein